MKTVYKVVYKRNGEYQSCYSLGNRLNYKIGIKTVPLFGKIFAFDSFRTAQLFYDNHYCMTDPASIFECETNLARKPRFIYSCTDMEKSKYFKQFWRSSKRQWVRAMSIPPGTLLCSDLTLITEV